MTEKKNSSRSSVNSKSRTSDSANPGNMYPQKNRKPKEIEKNTHIKKVNK